MHFTALIRSSREYLSCFDYDHYPECFQRFEDACAPLFAQLSESMLSDEAAAVIDALEADRAALSRRQQKDAAFLDKQVLALFLSPAAARFGGEAEAFARELCRQWNDRYPRNTYLPGYYDDIMKGFDATLLGIPLRKSKKLRRRRE